MARDAELIALERAGWQALTTARGSDYYREHLAKNAMMAFPFGIMDRQAAIDAMAEAPPWETFELIDPNVVMLSEDSGVVVYQVRAQRSGAEPYSAVISSTFVRRDGRWLLAFHQQTPT